MFEKREIIYNKKSVDKPTVKLHRVFILQATIFYILNSSLHNKICRNHIFIFKILCLFGMMEVEILNLKSERKNIMPNPTFFIKPFPYHYTPENSTKYYSIAGNLRVVDNLFLDGMRADYENYITGNCWGERQIAETISNLTHEFWDGCHWLIDKYGELKVREEEGLFTAKIKEMVKDMALMIDTEQLNLFPEIKPKERVRPAIVDYAETIYKSRVS